VVAAAVFASVVALRLDLGCSTDATDAIQNVTCDPRTGPLDVFRAALLVLAPVAALTGALWALIHGRRRALLLGASAALILVMGAADVGGAMTPEEDVPRVEGLTAQRAGGSLAVDVSLTGDSLLLLDYGSSDRRPRSVSEDAKALEPRVAAGFGPGYLLGKGEHRLIVEGPAPGRTFRAEAILPGAGNQRDRSRGAVHIRVPAL